MSNSNGKKRVVATASGCHLINEGLDIAPLTIAGGLAELADVTRAVAHKKC